MRRIWVLGLLQMLLLGQSVSTEILGLVTDPTGAVIAGAQISARRVATGDVRTTTTNATGNYIFPFLAIGEFEITCTAAGFKTVVRSGVALELQQKARIDFQLQLGQQAEKVEVISAAPMLRTEDATLGSLIDSKRVIELPLNGRNFSHLATLTPGVVFGLSRTGANGQGTLSDLAPPGQMVGISANGQRDVNQHITMDGVVAVDPLHSAMLFTPSIEAVEEMRVQSAVYSAEFGMNSGAQVSLSIKSGTNQLHGSLFEFVRNDKFDARGFFLVPSQSKNVLRRNQFGAVASGPLRKDKTFWLFSWESTRERRGTPARGSVASLAMRNGDFSELLIPRNRWYPNDANPVATRSIRPPGGGTPFPNNIIPASLINPASRNLLTWKPTSPFPEGGFLAPPNFEEEALRTNTPLNLVGTEDQAIDTNQYLGRVDHRFSDNDRIFGRYVIVPAVWDRVPLARVGRQDSDYRSQNLGIGYIKIVSPAVLNELRYGLNRTSQNSLGIHTDTDFTQRDLGLDFRVTVDNNRTLTPTEEGIPNINIAGYTGMTEGRPAFAVKYVHEISDNVTINRGKHNFKFGGIYRYNVSTGRASNFARGVLNFTQDIVGVPDAFAAFMLGIPTNASSAEGLPPAGDNAQNKFGFYALDDWKISSRLTLNLGVRWDIFGAVVSGTGRLRNLSFADVHVRTIDGRVVPMLVPDPGVKEKLYDIPLTQIMPRLGIAYRVNSTTVIRIGAGQFYNAQQMNNFTILNLAPPFSGSIVIENDRANPRATIQNPLAGTAAATGPQALIRIGNLQAERGNRSLFFNNYVYQWSLEVEKSFGQSYVAGIGYVGSAGVHMDNPGFNSNNPDPGAAPIQARRPVPFYVDSRTPDQLLPIATIRNLETNVNTNYHALQMRGEKRYSKGLTFSAAFNFQKAMAIGYEINSGGGFGPQQTQDPRNRLGDYGRSLIDQRFRFVFSNVWEIPWMRTAGGLKGAILGGWAINGVVSLTSGLPVTPAQSGDSHNTGAFSAPRPHVVPGQAVENVMSGRTLDRWFNTAAFVRSKCEGCPGEGVYYGPKGYGTAGRSLFEAPAMKTWDFGLFKEFPIREGHRLQLRWESFNFLNTPQFSAPNFTFGGATFGRISGTISNNREMQFALKYMF